MPRTNPTTVIPEQAYQDFLQAITHAVNASNKAKQLKNATNPNKLAIIKELITSITHITKNFKIYATRLANDKLFLPLIEEFVFSFIAKKIYEIKKEVGADYQGLLGSTSIKEEITRIEIYLNEQIMQLQDYQRSLQLSDQTRILIMEWQKNPLKQIDWQGLKQYKKELSTIQNRFKAYKTHLNPNKWLKPLIEFSNKLELITPGMPLAAAQNQPASATQTTTTTNDLELRKDIYALERILNYFDFAISVNLDKEPLGPSIIERALQVAGEYFKSSADSPHLSSSMEQKLQSLNVPLDRISELRNDLSHSGSFIFSIREKIKQGANKIEFFKALQRDLTKIRIVIVKIIYRINLKETKACIAGIATANVIPELQQPFAEIAASEDLNEIEVNLNKLYEKIDVLTIGEAEKQAIKLQIDGIRTNLNLKKLAKHIKHLEAINPNQLDLENILDNLDAEFESELYAELNLFKKNRVAPSKSTITAVSDSTGLENLPIDKNSINFSLSKPELFNLLVKETFKEYSKLYSSLTSGIISLGKSKTLNESLLLVEINSFASTNQLSLTDETRKQLIEKFKLFNQLEQIKNKFLDILEEIKYEPIKKSVLQAFAFRAKLDKKEILLLKESLHALHQTLFFNEFFENYFDTLLVEIKDKITTTEFNELRDKITAQKKSHRAFKKLLDFSKNLLSMSEPEYLALVVDLTPISVTKRNLLLASYSDKHKIKTTLKPLENHYENLLNGIKNQEFITDLVQKFKNFSSKLNLDPRLKNILDTIFEKNEIERFEKLFLEKLSQLKKIIELKKASGIDVQAIKANYEILLLDLTNIWRNLLKVSDPLLRNRLGLEHLLLAGTSIDKNFSLRNYLAHGDALFDAINPNFIDQILKNVPELVKDGKALLALKKLMDDGNMRSYLLNNIIAQGHIDRLNAEGLPTQLQHYSDLVREYKQSSRWQEYLETINPNALTPAASSPDQGIVLMTALLEKELHTAASKNDTPKLHYCIQQGANIDASDKKEWSAIYYAIDAESYETFNALLEKNAKLKRFDHAEATPVHYAVISQDIRFTNALMAKQKLIDHSKQGNWKLLHLAAVQNNRMRIDILLQNKINSIEESNQDGFTALLAAVCFEHTDLVKHLVKTYKANIHAVTKKKFSVTHLATINNNIELLKTLKQLDARLVMDGLNQAGWSAPHIAALKNLPHFLQYFIENNIDPNLKGRDGMTALHIAAQEGHIESIQTLMQASTINSHAVDKYGRSALLTAVSNEKLAAVEKILELQPDLINLVDRQGWSALHIAARTNNLKITQLLLKKGAEIDREKWDGATATHIAAENGYLEILEWLKIRHANFAKKAKNDWTLLHLACFHNNLQVVDYLLNLGALEINALTTDGFTALHMAAAKGYTDIVEQLLKTPGISIDKKTELTINKPAPAQSIKIEDATASHLATKNGHLSSLKKLVENGASLRLTGNEKWTHLHLAADSGHKDIVLYLLQAHPQIISIEAKTEEGATALHRAAYQGHLTVVNDLLLHQANIHAETKQRATPLHLAALSGHLDVVDILLQSSALLNAKTSDGLTPLALAAQYGRLNVVEKLLSLNADALSKNKHDTILHRATMSGNVEVIKKIINKIKTQFANTPRIQQALNAGDKEGDTPLIWAVQGQNADALETLLQEGADLYLANKAGNTAFDIAVEIPYFPVNRSEKEAIKIWKTRISRQQKIIDILYLKKHPSPEAQAMKNTFSTLMNEEFRSHVDGLEFDQLKALHNTLDQTGNAAFWNAIASKIKTRISQSYPTVALDPVTGQETAALRDLMRTFTWVSLDDSSLNTLNANKAILAEKKRQKAIIPQQKSTGCSTRKKRTAALNCLATIDEEEKFDPFIEFSSEENEAATLLIAGAKTKEQRNQLTEILLDIHQIKTEESSHQSQKEHKKLALFHETIENFLQAKNQYLQATKDINQAKVIKLSNHQGKIVTLSIHSEMLEGSFHLSIYCPQINRHDILLNPDITINKVLELYASLLFPEQSAQSLNYVYYEISSNPERTTLSNTVETLSTSDFRSDKKILENNDNRIEGLKITEFRELFLVNGKVPEIEQLHIDIFKDPTATITFRSDKIVDKLWQMSAEQQSTLATVLNKYTISEANLDSEASLPFEIALQEFNRQLIEKLKTVTRETPITHEELTESSKQYLRQELLAEGLEAHEIEKTIKNVIDLHGNLNQGASHAVGMARQSIFFAPAIIQAMNGDSRGLNSLLMMMGGDMTIDHLYQAIVNNAQFIERFPKTSRILAKSARYLASPIGKILLLDSFVELGKQLQESEAGRPEYQLAESLLANNSLLFTTMVAETLGLELGPAGILLDLGITIHQLLVSAKYYRDTLPFKISFWESIEISLGFKKTWLEEKYAEHYIRDVQLRQMNDLTTALQKVFYSAIVVEPRLEIHAREEITLDKLPTEMQEAISKNLDQPQNNFEWSYKPPQIIYRKYPNVKRPAEYRHITYMLKDIKKVTVALEPSTAKQENSIFLRSHQVCNRRKRETIKSENTALIRKKRVFMQVPISSGGCTTHLLYSQGYWRVAGSTRREDGEEFPSPVTITGGLAGLMLNSKHPNLTESNLLINFNSCFGALSVTGGTFLKNKIPYVLVSNLMIENVLDPTLNIPVTRFNFSNIKGITDEITYIVGQNYHPSEIKDDAETLHIVLLPINFKPELSGLRSHLNKATFSSEQAGKFCLGEIGPQFIGLDTKKRVIISFHKDYLLSGNVKLDTKSFQLEQVSGNFTRPANFQLKKEQSFTISLLAGKTTYQLGTTKELEVTYKADARGPQIIKPNHDGTFKLYITQAINDLSLKKDASSTSLSLINVINIKKFNSNATLSIHGNYFFKGNQSCQAELKIMEGAISLTLIDIADHKQLLRDPNFFNTIQQQNLDSVNFYSSSTRSNISVALHSAGQQMTYQAITYRLNSEHGLVAIQGRTNSNANSEDFSDMLTPVIDLQNNTTLPLRLNSTTIEFEARRLLNLKPNSYLLTAKGKVPMGLLPLQLPSPQQGDSIRLDEISDLLHPSAEIDRVSLKPGGLGSSDSLMVHYRPRLRLKRAISASIAEENTVEICFKKSDDRIPKTVVIDGKSFPVDFSELPLLNPQKPIVISHNPFEQLSHYTALQTEEVNGEILAEMRLETNKPSNQVIYRIPLNVQSMQTTLRFIDTETKQEKQLSIKLPVHSKYTWQYASASIGVAVFGAAALIARYFKPQNNNPLPMAAVALPLLPRATAAALPRATEKVVKTMTETTAAIVRSFWKTATQSSEKIRGERPNGLHIAPFVNANKQSFFDSPSSFSTKPSPTLSDLGEQLFNQTDKSSLLQLMHFYILSRDKSKITKAKKPKTFCEATNRQQAIMLANKVIAITEAEMKQHTLRIGISYKDLAKKIDFIKLQENLTNCIEVGNIEAIASTLHNSIKILKNHNIMPKHLKKLEAYIDSIVDQFFLQKGLFASNLYQHSA